MIRREAQGDRASPDATGGDSSKSVSRSRSVPELELGTDELLTFLVRTLRSSSDLARNPALSAELSALFCGSAHLSPAQQLEIYREQFWLRHTSSLLEDFPGVAFLLGQEQWKKLSESYLLEEGSLTRALRELGSNLPKHLVAKLRAGWSPPVPGDLVLQMAQLEWAYVDVFDAPDEAELDAQQVAALTPEQWPRATFVVSQAVRLLVFDYPVADFRRAIKSGEAELSQLPVRSATPEYAVVYRRERRLWDKQLSAPAFFLLEQLARGNELVRSCEEVARRLPESESRLEQELFTWFALWGRMGWIRGVVPGPPQVAEDSSSSAR